jgi:hypothetical protein
LDEIAACPENLRAFGAPDGMPWGEIKSPHGLMEVAWPQLRDFFRDKRSQQERSQAAQVQQSLEAAGREFSAAAEDAALVAEMLTARQRFEETFATEAERQALLDRWKPAWVSNPSGEPGRSLAIRASFLGSRTAENGGK